MWLPQWCISTVLYLLCIQWFLFATHSGISSPEPQSQVEWQESSPASLRFWILANSLLWWLESRVWKYYLQTPGFLKVWIQKRNFIWHFEQTDVFSLSNEPCISLCFKRKKDLKIRCCELYGWGDLGWCRNTSALQIPFITMINPGWWLNKMVWLNPSFGVQMPESRFSSSL